MEDYEAKNPPTPPPTTPTPLAPKPSSSSNKIIVLINLILRILISIFLLIALIVLATDSGVLAVTLTVGVSVHFQDSTSYRYMMASIVIGLVYGLAQTGVAVYQAITGRCLFNGKPRLRFDFYADKVVSGLLATAAGAGFAAGIELKAGSPGLGDFFDKGNATASLVLFAYLFNEASHILSFYAFP